MAEFYFVVKKQVIKYEGIVSLPELYLTMDEWFYEKGYDKKELSSDEIVDKDSKYVELLLEPWKKLTEYSKNVIRVHVKIFNVVDADVTIDGHKIKMSKAKVRIETEGFIVADYEDRWDRHPMSFFMRTIWDKFFYKLYHQHNAGVLKDHCKDLRAHIKAFLNLYRFRVEK